VRPRHEIEQAVEHLDSILERLRNRESELAGAGNPFAELQLLEVKVDVATRTRQRLQNEMELTALHIADLKRLLSDDAARELLGESGTVKKSVVAEVAKAERELQAISAQHDGLASLIAERTAAWASFRAANLDALRAGLEEEAEAVRVDLAAWLEQRAPLEARWRAMDKRWAAVVRQSYATGSGAAGHVPGFPVKVSGQAARPMPREVEMPRGPAFGAEGRTVTPAPRPRAAAA
jgi:hypothetical protein